ncbi:MAG: 7TM diverse intracellular signaling domain-containing protein [Bacteroidota bacterium]|nr:7TM diverse intracellular signaling domain-containing protein [Bacteroidota bacterium]
MTVTRPPYGRVWVWTVSALLLGIAVTGCSTGEAPRNVDALILEALNDPGGTLRAEEVHLRLAALDTLDGERPNLGSLRDAVWIRVSGWQGAPRQARIILDNPTIDSIEAVVMDGPRVLMRTPSGAAFGRSEDLIPTFSLPLNEAHDLWFRIRSTKPLVLPFTLTHEERVESLRDNRDLAVALYTGIVLAILIYNCFLAFSTGQQAYFSYVLVVLTVGLVQWGFNGYDRLIWGHVPWLARNGLTMTGAASGLAALTFAREFLEVRRYTPGWNRVINGLLLVYASAMAASVAGFPIVAYNLVNLGALSAPAMLALSLISWRRGNSPALWFFVAWLIFLIAVTMQALRDFGLLASTQFTALFLPVGTVLEMLLLSFALGDRINLLKRSSDAANAKALAASLENERIVKQQNAELEERVARRTEDLATANSDLSRTLGELQGAQDQLIQTEKLASLGQMTAGIAHELNNPINYVQSNATSLRRDLEELIEIVDAHADALAALAEGASGADGLADAAREKARKLDLSFLKEESRQLIAGILEGADRTARIVGGLRVFGRMDGDKPVEASLSDLLEASITVLGDRARSRARIEVDLPEDVPPLYCQSGKLSQVFMNIIVNAVQATEGRWSDPEERLVRVELDRALDGEGKAHSVIVRVRDNGTGMDEETRQRLFDPFFTTKEIGKGTGLGLSIVKGILDDHGAQIRVESEMGEGTTFVLIFPLDIMSNPNSEAA